MDSFPLAGFDGYSSQTLSFKQTEEGDIQLDVVYPEISDGLSSTVVIHYHGGFLVFGDRFTFLPYWLVHACVARKWIFVSPEYRLLPEATAEDSLQDARDAYEWVLSSLPGVLGRDIGRVLMAGSSAGGYLALATSTAATKKPDALLTIYGMLDPTAPRYRTPGHSVWGMPAIDTGSILRKHLKAGKNGGRNTISAYPIPLPPNPQTDERVLLVEVLHKEGLFVDYMTGVDGLGAAIANQGTKAIPQQLNNLFPLSFGDLAGLPPTMVLHGKNDIAVPVTQSLQALDKIRAAGVEIHGDFPDDAGHGFDAKAGNIDVETTDGDRVAAFRALRNAIKFLDSSTIDSQR